MIIYNMLIMTGEKHKDNKSWEICKTQLKGKTEVFFNITCIEERANYLVDKHDINATENEGALVKQTPKEAIDKLAIWLDLIVAEKGNSTNKEFDKLKDEIDKLIKNNPHIDTIEDNDNELKLVNVKTPSLYFFITQVGDKFKIKYLDIVNRISDPDHLFKIKGVIHHLTQWLEIFTRVEKSPDKFPEEKNLFPAAFHKEILSFKYKNDELLSINDQPGYIKLDYNEDKSVFFSIRTTEQSGVFDIQKIKTNKKGPRNSINARHLNGEDVLKDLQEWKDSLIVISLAPEQIEKLANLLGNIKKLAIPSKVKLIVTDYPDAIRIKDSDKTVAFLIDIAGNNYRVRYSGGELGSQEFSNHFDADETIIHFKKWLDGLNTKEKAKAILEEKTESHTSESTQHQQAATIKSNLSETNVDKAVREIDAFVKLLRKNTGKALIILFLGLLSISYQTKIPKPFWDYTLINTPEKKAVVLIDGNASRNVYNPIYAKNGETNAHNIRDILKRDDQLNKIIDQYQIVVTGNIVHTLEQVNSDHADLIIIHRSTFERDTYKTEEDYEDPEKLLETFISKFKADKSVFLIYSREENTDSQYEQILHEKTGISKDQIKAYQFKSKENPLGESIEVVEFKTVIESLLRK